MRVIAIREKAIVITGGSHGLGRSLALRLSQEGAKVLIVGRDRHALDDVVDEIRKEGGRAFCVVADVGDKESVYPIVGQAAALVGPVDILINNASTLGPLPLRLLPDTDCEDFERTLQVNTIGPFRLMKAVLGSMVLRETGTIVNISSDAAVEAYPTWGVYSASKAALDHITRIAAVELAETAVRFLIVDPGEMNTRMHADAQPGADVASLETPERVAGKIVDMIRHADDIRSGSRLIASEWETRHETSTRAAQ